MKIKAGTFPILCYLINCS